MGNTTRLRLNKLKYVFIVALLCLSTQSFVDPKFEFIDKTLTFISKLFNADLKASSRAFANGTGLKKDRVPSADLQKHSEPKSNKIKTKKLKAKNTHQYNAQLISNALGGLPPKHNETPVAVAGPSLNIEFGENITLDGSKSYDPENQKLSFHWVILSVPPQAQGLELESNTEPIVNIKSPPPGPYKFSLIVSDGENKSLPDVVEVLVGQNQGLPKAVITGSEKLSLDEIAFLSAEQSYDPNNYQIVSYRWSLISPQGAVEVGTNSELQLRELSEGVHSIALEVFNGFYWSEKAYRQIYVKDHKEIEIKILGNTNLLSQKAHSYKAVLSRKLKKNESLNWFFNYTPEGSQSEIKTSSPLKAQFTPDKKGIYILKAAIQTHTQKTLATDSINIFSNPNVLNKNQLVKNENKKQDKLFISAGGLEYLCQQQKTPLKLSGHFGGMGAQGVHSPSWQLISKPSGSEAQVRKDSRGSYYLEGYNTPGVYKIKFSIQDSQNNTLEDIKTVHVLHSLLEFNMPSNLGIPQEILDVSRDEDYGHQVFLGESPQLYKRIRRRKKTTGETNTFYLVFEAFNDEEKRTVVSASKSFNSIKDSESFSDFILHQWPISPKKNRKYYLKYGDDVSTQFVFIKKGSKYSTHKYTRESYPVYIDLPLYSQVISKTLKPGEKLILNQIDYIPNKPYYFNSRPFHNDWYGVLKEEKDIPTFEVIKKIINQESCFKLQIL